MAGGTTREGGGRRGRLLALWDDVSASFGFPTAVAMALALIVGLILPALDDRLEISVPALTFDSQSSARSLLETIGTATTAVAGLSFSVTVVALTLASQQLSPRVLRSFSSDRLSQLTLALFLGTFVCSLTLLVRIGTSGEDARPPNLSITLAVVLAFAAFAVFAMFIAHIINLLQPSSVITSIRDEASRTGRERYPGGAGEPEDPAHAAELAAVASQLSEPYVVDALEAGYLTVVDTDQLIRTASEADLMIRQRVPVGDFVLPGVPLAEVYVVTGGELEEEVRERLAGDVRGSFVTGAQRTLVQDIAFPVRQLADIALKGLSPGINDPTTSENAIDALGSLLIEFARSGRPSAVRVDSSGQPRFVAEVADLDDLIELGFEQVRMAAVNHPVVLRRMQIVLDRLSREAVAHGLETLEDARQRRLIEVVLAGQTG